MLSKYLTIQKYGKLGVFVFFKVSFPKDMSWKKSNGDYTFSVGYYLSWFVIQ